MAVHEISEAQTLANFFRFPMIFLGGILTPLASMPTSMQVLARLLPLTMSVEALSAALNGGSLQSAWFDLAAPAGFTVVLSGPAVWIFGCRVE